MNQNGPAAFQHAKICMSKGCGLNYCYPKGELIYDNRDE